MDFEMIAPKEVERYLHRQDTFIIDLRSPEEYRDRHLLGALNIPYERRKNCCLFPKTSCISYGNFIFFWNYCWNIIFFTFKK